MKSKDSDLIAEAYSKVCEQTTNAQPGPGRAIPMPMGRGGNTAVPMPMGKGGSNMAVPMPGLNKQNTKPQSQFNNTTVMERMKDFWDLLVATQTGDEITAKRIFAKYGMPKTTSP